MARPTSRFLE
ncbi:hypothetical protein E2C01_098318 [Portunus trituberculatus]|uniref:Uncharacterized protein n=1 Tax=Portunus trituberculatus TaxID=210409 RepID=A0A5B7K6R5_PORTR|nr:hypothetical protein [Portunus trituberculatus]